MVFAGVDGESQVGGRPLGANPLSVEANAQRGAVADLIPALVENFDDVNQALAGFGLGGRLIFSRLGVELDLRGATRGFGGGERCILRKGRS